MIKKIKAVFRAGAFFPIEDCDLPANSEYELVVQGPIVETASVSDETQRRELLAETIARMKRNQIPENAPRYTREELHERG